MSSSTSPFSSTSFYRFFNNVYPNHTISTGLKYTANTPVNMTVAQTYTSSENWQLYFQSDVYFIRNYAAGSQLQLGLTQDSDVVPQLLPRSGDLGQQWSIAPRDDGTYRLTNKLVGDQSSIGISAKNTVPGIDADDDDGHWQIGINVSAGQITNAEMLTDNQNIEVSSPCNEAYSQYLTLSSPSSISLTKIHF
jgi:hypothetical protein